MIPLYCSTNQLDLLIMLMLSERSITFGGISTRCGYSDISACKPRSLSYWVWIFNDQPTNRPTVQSSTVHCGCLSTRLRQGIVESRLSASCFCHIRYSFINFMASYCWYRWGCRKRSFHGREWQNLVKRQNVKLYSIIKIWYWGSGWWCTQGTTKNGCKKCTFSKLLKSDDKGPIRFCHFQEKTTTSWGWAVPSSAQAGIEL